jgi:hypothetical protein
VSLGDVLLVHNSSTKGRSLSGLLTL